MELYKYPIYLDEVFEWNGPTAKKFREFFFFQGSQNVSLPSSVHVRLHIFFPNPCIYSLDVIKMGAIRPGH